MERILVIGGKRGTRRLEKLSDLGFPGVENKKGRIEVATHTTKGEGTALAGKKVMGRKAGFTQVLKGKKITLQKGGDSERLKLRKGEDHGGR